MPFAPDKWFVSTQASPDAYTVYFEQLWEHLRVEQDQAGPIRLYLMAAVEYAERRLASAILPQSITVRFEDGEPMKLPRGPLLEITSVTDDDGTPITAYVLRYVGRSILLELKRSATFPLTVVYRAGYTTTTLPNAIKVAVMTHAGTLYENRESVSDKAKVPVPHSLEDFYRAYTRDVGVY